LRNIFEEILEWEKIEGLGMGGLCDGSVGGVVGRFVGGSVDKTDKEK
jgi:hypothetical protein